MGHLAREIAGSALCGMNRLGEKIASLIRTAGPISVSDYMALCLFDPEHGYYMTHEPFGVEGDFVTSPEISQIFGELVAVWLFQAWQGCGSPLPATIAEIGPGRGTLMKDMIRALQQLAPDLAANATFALVEASPRLTAIQQETLRDTGACLEWHSSVESLPKHPLFVAGNEIFDALPFRQFVKHEGKWLERAISLDSDDAFRFGVGTASLSAEALPEGIAPDGSIFEIAPIRESMMSMIAALIDRYEGAGIFFDYGHSRPGFGDTFQAVRRHLHEGVFDNPGQADLTSHVDFSALASIVHSHGLSYEVVTQGKFLIEMGLLERAGQLGRNADDIRREKITSDVERLAGPDQMGELFKVLKIRRQS